MSINTGIYNTVYPKVEHTSAICSYMAFGLQSVSRCFFLSARATEHWAKLRTLAFQEKHERPSPKYLKVWPRSYNLTPEKSGDSLAAKNAFLLRLLHIVLKGMWSKRTVLDADSFFLKALVTEVVMEAAFLDVSGCDQADQDRCIRCGNKYGTFWWEDFSVGISGAGSFRTG